MDTTEIQGPAWKLSSEYESCESSEFEADRKEIGDLVSSIEGSSASIAGRLGDASALDPVGDAALLAECQKCAILVQRAEILHRNLSGYVNCLLSVDGSDARAKELRGGLCVLGASLESAAGALQLMLVLSSEPFCTAFLALPETSSLAYGLGRERRLAKRKLSLPEERQLASFRPDGHIAWSNLYDSITGTMQVLVKSPGGAQRLGLAQASSILRQSDRTRRIAAYEGVKEAFRAQEESCAAILDALAGWRHTENRLRSRGEKVHFLDAALEANHLRSSTLDAMMAVVDESVGIGRRALDLQARLLGIPCLGPWDLVASAPAREDSRAELIPFEEGIALVAEAYGSVDPAMGDFILEMAREKRIEGRSMPGKRPGAYCTSFPKSRRTRVYMVYRGSASDISTLAHELGHAWHGRVVEALPLAETRYPMCLAETASTFGEAIVGESLAGRREGDASAMLELAWSQAQDAATFLLNIPARFAFEKAFYEARAERPLGPDALRGLMKDAWKRYYGDSLCEYDDMFWASKLHFHMTGLSFYNFPYTFGYLFSLGILARREEMGESFPSAYASLLRDTGRMDVEDLAMKHLGADISAPDFWRASVAMVKGNVERFASLVEGKR
jgi:oligoendopeptidase F